MCSAPVSVVLFLLFCTSFGQEATKPRCYGRNEEYTDCGSACELTCDTALATDLLCIQMCVPGCFCKNGHLRNRWGVCIKAEKCPCHLPNEIFTCGSTCGSSCGNLDQDCKRKKCVDACYCRDGYLRASNSSCVRSKEC